MFGKLAMTEKDTFLERTKAAREEREMEKKKEICATKLQAVVRGWICRIKFARTIHEEFDKMFPPSPSDEEECVILSSDLIPAIEVYRTARRLFLIYKFERDKQRIERLCRYILASLQSESVKLSYVGVFLIKEHSIAWITHIKELLYKCCQYLDILRPESPTDMQIILLHLHTLVAFTATSTWAITKLKHLEKLRPGMTQLCANIMGALFHRGYYLVLKSLLVRGLCRERVALKSVSLTAIITLSMRPLISSQFSEKLFTMYIIQILSVPGLVHHMELIAPECLAAYKSHAMLDKSVEFLSTDQNLRIVFNTLEGNLALCLLANIVHLASMDERTSCDIYFPSFVVVVTRFLEWCQQLVVGKQSQLSSWHPVLGWVVGGAGGPGGSGHGGAAKARGQLGRLWGAALLKRLLAEPLQHCMETLPQPPVQQQTATTSTNAAVNFVRRAIEARTNRANSSKNYRKLGSPECTNIALICSMYQTALTTMSQLKLDIVTGLCNQDLILYYLWMFICSLGSNCGLKSFMDLLAINTKTTAPEFQILILFSDCMTHYVTILDDMEMYEQQSPFKLTDFVCMSNFLNLFLYKGVLANLFGELETKTITCSGLFGSLHGLLQVLYRRDCRRSYTPPGHWLAKDLRVGTFIADLDKGKKAPQLLMMKMPHIIPHTERVQLFRRSVANEKAVLGLTEQACASARPTLITVHRRRVLEDGYRQLAALPSHALKGVIRVRFINEQGLDEAGIDQDGVFKEFLEETIKLVFDPTLDLFRATSESRLYPSPTAALHDSHLQLFEFVGRMLGKAVYEGIVVDVPFASFFLSQVLGQTQQALYSWIDELPSLDKELYRSLTYIKHHQGEISSLELTFSVDEDRLGDIVTHELIPGGRAIPLTNENKINYIHLMAHFRMHTQIKEQTQAFIKGFRSIINPEWLSLFSTPEVQRLISGDTAPLDLRDLRRNTQYYGGFHDSHRVVAWLWDVLHKDFSEEERSMFLKFVTSCSKPPLLGFAHLEPPFSIRCVEVGDDEDTGDTIGSVIRGFFTIRKKDPLNRLPTSSTCFNLLKLPNYQKRSTLRDKLRYAVNSNTGFELS